MSPHPCFPARAGKPEDQKEDNRMHNYELALVLSAKMDDESRAAKLEKAKGYITHYNGTIGNVDDWGKKKLAYEIEHEREGFYYFIPFEADPTAPAEIERHLRIMDDVLRYLIIRTDAE
jgi:small subunit ribosomal protein S6